MQTEEKPDKRGARLETSSIKL